MKERDDQCELRARFCEPHTECDRRQLGGVADLVDRLLGRYRSTDFLPTDRWLCDSRPI